MKRYKICGGLLMILAVVFAAVFLLGNDFYAIRQFRDIVISSASADNVDVSRMSLVYSGFIICCFAGFWSLLGSPHKKKEYQIKSVEVSDSTRRFVISTLSVFFLAFAIYQLLFSETSLLVFAVAVSFGVGSFFESKDFTDYFKRSVRVLSVSFLVWQVANFLLLFFAQIVMPKEIGACAIVGFTVATLRLYKKDEKMLLQVGKNASFVGCFLCLLSEICYVMKCRGIAMNHMAFFILCGFSFAMLVVGGLRKKKEVNSEESEREWSRYLTMNVVALIWISCFWDVKDLNPFEMSNHALSISEFIQFGKFPLIDNFDAHMLSNSLPGIIFYFLTGDPDGALRTPYAYLYSVLLFVVLFKVLSYMVDKDLAYLGLVMFPAERVITSTIALPTDSTFLVGMFMLPAFLYWKEHKNVRAHFLIWILAACSVLIQLDTGVAFGIAALILAAVELLRTKDVKNLILFGVIGAGLAGMGLGALLLLLNGKMGLVDWIKRFLKVALSDQNWAITDLTMGEKGIYYILVPSLFFLITWILISILHLEGKKRDVLIFVMLAFVLNAKRTIVRHTIHENEVYVTGLVTFGAVLLVIEIIMKIMEAYGHQNFHKIQFVELKKEQGKTDIQFRVRDMLRFFMIFGGALYLGKLLATNPFASFDDRAIQVKDTYYKESVANEKEEWILQLEEKLNQILGPDETFFDFSNSTYLYTYLKRENPIYENQSPALINGLDRQKEIVELLKEKRDQIPLVLMQARGGGINVELDDIRNSDRYYLISEYLYDQYSKCYVTDRYEIWCLKEREQEISEFFLEEEEKASYFSGNETHELGYIPYLWANKADVKYEDHEKLAFDVNEDTEAIFDPENGNFLCVELNASTGQENYELSVEYENGTSETYKMQLVEGKHPYLIRISTDYDWYISKVKNITVSENAGVDSLQFAFMK